MTRSQYLNATSQFLRLSIREAMLLPVGQAMDLVGLEVDRRNPNKRKEA